MSPSTTAQTDGCLSSTEKNMCSALQENQTSIWTNDPYPPSTSPLDKLKKIFISDMIVGSHHRGSYIFVKAASKSALRTGLGVAFDEMGNCIAIRILHQDGQHLYDEHLGDVEFLIIKEPFYKALPGSSIAYIRIYHFTDMIALSPGEPRRAKIWEKQVEMTMDELRLAGNQEVKEKEFYTAIDYYSRALLQARMEGDIEVIRLNRCFARLQLQCFDAALEDANAVLANSDTCEKALFRKAEALYGLRQFKEAGEILDRLTILFPLNKMACQRLERVRNRLQELVGIYDFSEMLKEILKPTGLDRASYIGCVEVRPCKVKSRGRGLFLTKAVKAGELLLCEKAFSVSLMSVKEAVAPGRHGDGLDEARDSLQKDCVFRLHRNPSLIPAFTELHSGYYHPEEVTRVDGQAIIDGYLVDAIVTFNCYKFPQSNQFHRRLAHSLPASLERPYSAGLWIFASYINHSCMTNVERSFLGDMIIIRAAQDLAAGSELMHSYVGVLDVYEERQNNLKHFGFRCICRRCENENATLLACREKRKKNLNNLEAENCRFATSNAKNPLKTIEKFLDDLDTTYNLPASLVPRMEMCVEIFIASMNFHGWGMAAEVIIIVRRLLLASGFHMRINKTRFRITHWGTMDDFLVIGLAFMWKAYETVNPALCDDVEGVLKTAYEIVVGERSSFEEVYSTFRPNRKDSTTSLAKEAPPSWRSDDT